MFTLSQIRSYEGRVRPVKINLSSPWPSFIQKIFHNHVSEGPQNFQKISSVAFSCIGCMQFRAGKSS